MKKEMQQPYTNTPLLCRRSEAPELIRKAERERDVLLDELRVFYTGDIGVNIRAVDHVMGTDETAAAAWLQEGRPVVLHTAAIPCSLL